MPWIYCNLRRTILGWEKFEKFPITLHCSAEFFQQIATSLNEPLKSIVSSYLGSGSIFGYSIK